MDLTRFLYSPEAYATWKHKIEKSPDLMFTQILERFRSGANVLASDFIFCLGKINRSAATISLGSGSL